jgi:hypothetical protein
MDPSEVRRNMQFSSRYTYIRFLMDLSDVHFLPDEDIVNFLLSRYGVDISEEEVRAQVMHGLGGGNGCIDLMEMMCMLMIPTLLKAASPEELPADLVRPPNGLIDFVLHTILHDVRSFWGRGWFSEIT